MTPAAQAERIVDAMTEAELVPWFVRYCEENEGPVFDFIRREVEKQLRDGTVHVCAVSPWPPRTPTPADHAEIADLQVAYLAALRSLI